MIRFLTLGSVLGVLVLAGAGLADVKDQQGKEKKGKGKARQARAEAIFKKMDANGDGKVSLEEFNQFREAVRAARKNKANEKGKGKGPNLDRLFKKWDTNGDGFLSEDEFKKGLKDLQEQRDKLKGKIKGKIDPSKIEKLKKKRDDQSGK